MKASNFIPSYDTSTKGIILVNIFLKLVKLLHNNLITTDININNIGENTTGIIIDTKNEIIDSVNVDKNK